MRRLVAGIFEYAGCMPEEAGRIAMRLSGANLRGHDSHGVIRTPRYLQYMADGLVVANQSIEVLSDSEVITIIDGRYGFGQTVGEQAVDVGVAKAKRYGVGVVALRNAGHLGRIGDWAERAAASNCASIHMVNVRGSLLVAPYGGIDRRAGTSPFCVGIPLPGGDHIVHDFATSLVAEGKAYVALRGGEPLPEGSLVTPEGTLTADPRPLYGEVPEGGVPSPYLGPGALNTFGLHKGSGLNFFMEMFAGALGGSGTVGALGDTGRRRFCNGMFSIYLHLHHFHADPGWFANEVHTYVEFWKSARPVTADGEVLIPGEKEKRIMAERLASGLPLAPMAWEDILGAARSVGMDEDAIAGAIG
jgi:uncharacterized oxidoreductase